MGVEGIGYLDAHVEYLPLTERSSTLQVGNEDAQVNCAEEVSREVRLGWPSLWVGPPSYLCKKE